MTLAAFCREAAINLRQLRYFSKVVELGNMTRAADYLNVAQPALGLQIRQLEEDLGSQLLNRHSRGVEPTAAGLTLFERAQQILALVDETRAEMRALRGSVSETVRLGLTPSIMSLIGYDLLVEAREEIPQVLFSVTDELGYALIDATKRGELDLALAYEVDDEPWLAARPLFEEELLFVSALADVPPGTISFADALSYPLILPCARDLVRKLIDNAAAKQGVKLRLAFEVNSPMGIKTMVLREGASTIVPYGAVAEEIRDGRLQARRIARPEIVRRLYLVRPAGAKPFQHEAAIEAFMQRMIAKLAVAVGELMRPIAARVPAVAGAG
jgi:LysR family transcriptional regulator, nitrogen assimilation regulatory protein